MRDINRIDDYCVQLAQMWKRLPDWRFTQLLANYARENGGISFYMEDEDFFRSLAEYVDQNVPPVWSRSHYDDLFAHMSKKDREYCERKLKELKGEIE